MSWSELVSLMYMHECSLFKCGDNELMHTNLTTQIRNDSHISYPVNMAIESQLCTTHEIYCLGLRQPCGIQPFHFIAFTYANKTRKHNCFSIFLS